MSIDEEAIRNAHEMMLDLHPDQKPILDIMLKLKLEKIGVKP